MKSVICIIGISLLLGITGGVRTEILVDQQVAATSYDELCIRGQIYMRKADYESAVKDYSTAIALNPLRQEAFCGRARALSYAHDQRGALADCNQAIRIAPSNAWVYGKRAIVWYYLGYTDNSLRDVTKAINLDPGNDWNFAVRGLMLESIRDYEGAMRDYTQSIKLHSKLIYPYEGRARIFIRAGNLNAALIDCMRLLNVDPINGISPVCGSVPKIGAKWWHTVSIKHFR